MRNWSHGEGCMRASMPTRPAGTALTRWARPEGGDHRASTTAGPVRTAQRRRVRGRSVPSTRPGFSRTRGRFSWPEASWTLRAGGGPLRAIRRVRLEFTEAYGRAHAGGIGPEGPNLSFFVRGEPLVLDLEDGERIYLIVDRNPITGRTRNREWYDALRASIPRQRGRTRPAAQQAPAPAMLRGRCLLGGGERLWQKPSSWMQCARPSAGTAAASRDVRPDDSRPGDPGAHGAESRRPPEASMTSTSGAPTRRGRTTGTWPAWPCCWPACPRGPRRDGEPAVRIGHGGGGRRRAGGRVRRGRDLHRRRHGVDDPGALCDGEGQRRRARRRRSTTPPSAGGS